MHIGIDAQRLLALFGLGWLLFNFPLLGLWDMEATVLGVPWLLAALFGIWLLLIAMAAWLIERPADSAQED